MKVQLRYLYNSKDVVLGTYPDVSAASMALMRRVFATGKTGEVYRLEDVRTSALVMEIEVEYSRPEGIRINHFFSRKQISG